MDHSWRPNPIQGNICPTCSFSHFPFCPPNSHPSAYSTPAFDSIRSPINFHQTNYNNNPGDPYYDPSYSNRNPSFPHVGDFGTVNRGPYPMKNHGSGYGDGGYMWNDYSNVNNRSSKRLRVDGNDCGPYGPNGVARVSSNFHVEDNEKRLKSVHDQGVFNPGFGFGGDVRGYASGSSGFDWNFDGWHHGNSSNCGLRPPGNVEMRNSLGTGHNVHFGSQFVMNRSASNVEQDVLGNQYQQQAQYGQVENPSDPSRFYQGGVGHDINGQGHGYHYSNYGNSHGLKEMYSGNVDSMHPNNAPMHNDHRNNMPSLNHYPNNHSPLPSTGQQPGRLRYDYGSQHQISDVHPPPVDGYQVPTGNQNVSTQAHYGVSNMNYQGGYGNSNSDKMAHMHASLGYDVQPPLPTSPPPPLPREPPVSWPVEQKPLSSPLIVSSSLFPVHADSSAAVLPAQVPIPESHSRAAPLLLSSQTGHTTRGAFQGVSDSCFFYWLLYYRFNGILRVFNGCVWL